MINNFFLTLFSIDPNIITALVVVTCLALFWAAYKRDKKIREIAPALMVSAGIIGTFWGTFVALSAFPSVSDTGGSRSMLESIPAVLDGMKSAFVTSLIGLISAFGAKIYFHRLPLPPREEDEVEKSSRELLEAIRDGISGEGDNSLSSRMQTLTKEHRDSIQEVKNSLSGDNDSSVISQLIELRNDNRENFNALNQQMEGLSEVIRDSLVAGMRDLVEELREVIVNQLTQQLQETNTLLRTHLTEMLDRIEEALINQFGQTFIQFNEATQAIRQWQQDHRVQVEQLTRAFDDTAKGIEKIREDCEKIPATMESLRNLMQNMGLLVGELDAHLKAFADMKQQAEESFPLIKKNLDKIGSDLQQSASGFSELDKTIQNVIGEMKKAVEASAKEMTTTFGAANDTMLEQVQNTAKNMEEALGKSAQGITDKLENVTNDYAKNINRKMLDVMEEWGQLWLGLMKEVEKRLNK